MLALSLGLVALGTLGFVLGESLAIYFPSRFLMGLGSGGVWIGVTFDTLARWPGQEYLCMSRIFAAYSAGGLIGAALGAFGGIQGPFLSYLALLLVAVPLVLVVGEPTPRRSFTTDRDVLRTPGFKLASAAILFAVLALGLFEGVLLPLRRPSRPERDRRPLRRSRAASRYQRRRCSQRAPAAARRRRRDIGLRRDRARRGHPQVPLWLLALVLAGVGVGLGNTGSIGVLVQAVPIERIVSAMVIWSQIGIAGYLLGPLLGGLVADQLGYAYLGLVTAVAGILVLVLFFAPVFRVTAPSSAGAENGPGRWRPLR